MGDYRPPAVTTEFFEEVCPHPTVLSVDAIRSEYSIGWDSAATMFDKYTTIAVHHIYWAWYPPPIGAGGGGGAPFEAASGVDGMLRLGGGGAAVSTS